MEITHQLVRYAHVAFGFAGLAAFWIPLLTRKGGNTHRLFGRIYTKCAWVVLASAGLAVILITTRLLLAGQTPATAPVSFAMAVFLGYLAFVTFVVIRHGVQVLQFKNRPEAQASELNIWLARGSVASTFFVIAWALVFSPPNSVLLYALSPIGILSGLGILRYLGNPPATPRVWMYEHLGSMIGGGIAFHTAFAVFGANRIFDFELEGWIEVVPWITPAALGIPATVLLTRHYRKKYGELA